MTGTMFAFASCTSSGCSTRQDTHHDAHTLSSHTWPFMSAGPSFFAGSCELRQRECGCRLADERRRHLARIARTARPTGSRPAPTKTASGSRKRSDFIVYAPRAAPSSASTFCRTVKPIAAVRHRDESAQRHQECAAPDPVDERLDVDAHAPRAGLALVGDGLAERHVAVAEEAGVDRGLGHRRAAMRCRRASPAAASRPACRRGDTSIVPASAAVVGAGDGRHAAERERVAADRDALADIERNVLLDPVALDQRDADDEHGDAEVREQHAVPRGRIRGELGGQPALRRVAQALRRGAATVVATIHSARNRPKRDQRRPAAHRRTAAASP